MQAYSNISLEQRSSMPPNQTMRWARRSIAEQNTLQASNHGMSKQNQLLFSFRTMGSKKNEEQLPSHFHMQLKQGKCVFFKLFHGPLTDAYMKDWTIRKIYFQQTCVSLGSMSGLEFP